MIFYIKIINKIIIYFTAVIFIIKIVIIKNFLFKAVKINRNIIYIYIDLIK